MSTCFKIKNYNTTATFCRRLLELNPTTAVGTKVRQVLAACEKVPGDELQLNYDPRNPFVTCGATLTPIYRGSKEVQCPYCAARFVPDAAGSLCAVCDLAIVAAAASGLLCSASQVR